jgi:glycosyltransferase involved in cell wall biosynthesis
MRILHLIPFLSSGGAERQLSYLAPELARMGHDVHIAYSKDGPNKLELPGVMLHQLKTRSSYDPYLLLQLIRLTQTIKPDIIHTWILQMDILGAIAAKVCGIPWILHEQSSAMGYFPSWKHWLRVWVASGASAIVSNSHGGDEYWQTQLPNSRRHIVFNGLPIHEIDEIVEALPTGFLKPDASIVLYVGRLISSKNLRAFLEALVYLNKRKDVYGVICGEGPQRSELEALTNKLGIATDVLFTGHLPATSVWALMKKASVFVSLSAYEGCPNTVMEAMACGCPLVLSNIPAHHEILDESCALFVDPSNIQQTANTVTEALLNMDTSKGRALIAKQKTQKWSILEMATKWERVYKEFI